MGGSTALAVFDTASPRKVRNRIFARRCIMISLPKAGTHLLIRALSLLPGIRNGGLHLGASTVDRLQVDQASPSAITVGIDFPTNVDDISLRAALSTLPRASFASGHVPYSVQMDRLLTDMHIKKLLIIRDPRDVALSHAKYVAALVNHPLYAYYQDLSEHERIMASIVGISAPNGPKLPDLRERVSSVLPWANSRDTYTTSFEKLVGPSGGGSPALQIAELSNLAAHLNVRCSTAELDQIAAQLFGGTATFRKGLIGSWKDEFSNEHVSACKELVGELLIELGYERDSLW